jgi:hypothetical protein
VTHLLPHIPCDIIVDCVVCALLFDFSMSGCASSMSCVDAYGSTTKMWNLSRRADISYDIHWVMSIFSSADPHTVCVVGKTLPRTAWAWFCCGWHYADITYKEHKSCILHVVNFVCTVVILLAVFVLYWNLLVNCTTVGALYAEFCL